MRNPEGLMDVCKNFDSISSMERLLELNSSAKIEKEL
jgi:hypothetical protein